MPSKYLIYALSDPRTDEVRYVGKSCSGMARPRQHTYPSFLKKYEHLHLYRWVNKLLGVGLQPQVEIVEELAGPEGLAEVERFWIEQFLAWGFRLTNLTAGGDGASGRIMTSATKEKIAATKRGKKRPEISLLNKARGHRPPSNKGRVLSEAVRVVNSRAHGGRPFVDQYGTVYATTHQAARILGLRQGNVVSVLKGRYKHTGGYIFQYLEQT